MAQPDPSPPAPVAEAVKTPPRIQIRVSWCKGCGLCVDYCNRGVLEMEDTLPRVVDAAKCSRCLLCEAICPDFAITVEDPPAPGEEGGP
jgi:2-oxoglutarate ferredoxin oxidoreductase subunit delta